MKGITAVDTVEGHMSASSSTNILNGCTLMISSEVTGIEAPADGSRLTHTGWVTE